MITLANEVRDSMLSRVLPVAQPTALTSREAEQSWRTLYNVGPAQNE
jgi:hypothetical protein